MDDFVAIVAELNIKHGRHGERQTRTVNTKVTIESHPAEVVRFAV